MIDETEKEYPFEESEMFLFGSISDCAVSDGPVRIGMQCDINGNAGRSVPASVTAAEVEMIVRKYHEVLIDNPTLWKVEYHEPYEFRMQPYANLRISHLIDEGAISKERSDEIGRKVLAEITKSVDSGRAVDRDLPW